MNGISLLVSKFCCPMYNPGTSKKINLIPHRLSNMHLQRSSPSLASTRMLKHPLCSSSKSIRKDVTGRVNTNGKDETVGVKLNASGAFLTESGKEDLVIFSVGDIIQFGYVEGRVVEMLPTGTVLFAGEKDHLIIPYDAIFSQDITNKTSGKPYDNMGCEVGFDIGDLDKVDDISKEIRNLMESNPYVLHEVEKPTCFIREVGFDIGDLDKLDDISKEIRNLKESNPYVLHEVEKPTCFICEAKNIIFRCHLKHMDPDIYFTAKEDILQQAGEIIEKHGGTSLKLFYWTYY